MRQILVGEVIAVSWAYLADRIGEDLAPIRAYFADRIDRIEEVSTTCGSGWLKIGIYDLGCSINAAVCN